MAGPDEGSRPRASIPSWQQGKDAVATTPGEKGASGDDTTPTAIEQAKRFLQDPEVRSTSRQKKMEFLRTKGFDDSVVDALLASDGQDQQSSESTVAPETEGDKSGESTQTVVASSVDPDDDSLGSSAQGHRDGAPPIITYPEFLTRRPRAPPLITVDGFLRTMYAFGGLSALLYGTSQLVLAPLVDSLTDARVSLHDTAAAKLGTLVEKLESTVSEIPAPSSKSGAAATHHHHHPHHDRPADADESSEYDDPTELFHRDIGVQTSPRPSSPGVGGETGHSPAQTAEGGLGGTQKQAQRVAELAAELRGLSDGLVSESEDYAETTRVLALFQNDLDQLAYRNRGANGAASVDFFGYARPSRGDEPDDEIQRARENIRRVKGALLSARTFPGPAR